jgi:hypothetical protein
VTAFHQLAAQRAERMNVACHRRTDDAEMQC